MKKPKFKVGDYVKKIVRDNICAKSKQFFKVGQIRKVTKITEYYIPSYYYMVEVEGFPGGNDPDLLELYVPKKLEKALF